MKRTGLGIRDWGLGKSIRLGILLGIHATALNGAPPAGESKPRFGVIVRVYDYARISRGEMGQAQTQASRIFREAGVEIDWVDCPTSVAEAADYPACELLSGAGGVDLRILPNSMALRAQSGREQLGFALQSAAWVFYHRVEELAASKLADRAQILGPAIAHEIGHLLLGPDGHSDKGIMRAHWDRKYLQEAAQGQLLFTREQAAVMRAEVRVRAQ